MLRAAALTLLVASVLAGSLEAQRVGAPFHGSAPGPPVRSGVASPRGFRSGSFGERSFSRHHFRHDRSGAVLFPYFFPYYEPYVYEEPQPGPAANEPAPAVTPVAAPEPPPPEAKVIEIPGAASAAPAKPLPPTVFILTSGERLESRRYVLTASDLSVTVNRHQRTIPLDMLDLDATLAANHSRGIDLEIPTNANEICLRF